MKHATPNPTRHLLTGACTALALLCAGLTAGTLILGCGGGGSSPPSAVPPPQTPPPPVTNVIQVGQGGAMFSPTSLTVNAGDTVTWQWASSGHSVDSGTNCSPDGQFSSGIQDAGFAFSHLFSAPGTYPYFCIPHCSMGMTGTVVVNAASTTILVGQGGEVFSPANLTIRAGQTVTWQWATSGHDVVSGANCTADSLFSSGGIQNAGFSFTHRFDTPGTYPFFCLPHCSLGMRGAVTVNP